MEEIKETQETNDENLVFVEEGLPKTITFTVGINGTPKLNVECDKEYSLKDMNERSTIPVNEISANGICFRQNGLNLATQDLNLKLKYLLLNLKSSCIATATAEVFNSRFFRKALLYCKGSI